MYNEKPPFPIRARIKEWSNSAKDCYELDCNCSKCFIYHTYFRKSKEACKMKYYVEYLLKKIGKPRGGGG